MKRNRKNMDYELLSTEKYEIYFQSSKLNDESYRRKFENTIYNILLSIYI